MNRIKLIVGMISVVLGAALPGFTTCAQPSVSVGVSVSLPAVEIRTESDFYKPLTPYGRWQVVGSYGRCWIPARVEADWRPYSEGYWQRTDAGWYWVSEEPWAWATYHYGRWNLSAQFGWYWVPQTLWAPAWVSWHSGGGYVGWAPLYPSNVRVISPRAYVFVEERHFMEPVRRSTVIVNNTSIINKTVIHEAPAAAVIEKESGRKIQALPVRELRQKEEEIAFAAKQKTSASTSEKRVQTAVPREVGTSGKRTITAPAPRQVEKPSAAMHESAARAPKKSQAQSETRKSAPATSKSKPAAKSEANHPAAIKKPSQQNPTEHPAKQEKSVQPSDEKAQRASEQLAKEKQGGNDKNKSDKADKGKD